MSITMGTFVPFLGNRPPDGGYTCITELSGSPRAGLPRGLMSGMHTDKHSAGIMRVNVMYLLPTFL